MKNPESAGWEERALMAVCFNEVEDFDEKREPSRWKINPEKFFAFILQEKALSEREGYERGYKEGQDSILDMQ